MKIQYRYSFPSYRCSSLIQCVLTQMLKVVDDFLVRVFRDFQFSTDSNWSYRTVFYICRLPQTLFEFKHGFITFMKIIKWMTVKLDKWCMHVMVGQFLLSLFWLQISSTDWWFFFKPSCGMTFFLCGILLNRVKALDARKKTLIVKISI